MLEKTSVPPGARFGVCEYKRAPGGTLVRTHARDYAEVMCKSCAGVRKDLAHVPRTCLHQSSCLDVIARAEVARIAHFADFDG